MPPSHVFQRFHDAVAHLFVEGHERTCLCESRASKSRVRTAVLAREEATGKWAPNQDTDVVVLGKRLELFCDAAAAETIIPLRRHISSQAEPRRKQDLGARLP